MPLFLSNSILRDNGCSLLKLGKQVFKVAITSKGRKTLLLEKRKYQEIKKDSFFTQYLLPYKFYPYTIAMPLCRPCSKDFIPEEYFKLFFSRNSHKTTTLDEVLDSSLLIKLLTNDADAILYVKRILHEVIICAGSIHGDFHIDNILHLDGKYYFIDIGSYRTNGSPYFDLIHYYIFENKENSWSCKAHQLLHSNISNLYGIDLSKKEIIGFIFHLISQDLQSAERTPERKKKYIALIKDCCLAYETMTTIQYS